MDPVAYQTPEPVTMAGHGPSGGSAKAAVTSSGSLAESGPMRLVQGAPHPVGSDPAEPDYSLKLPPPNQMVPFEVQEAPYEPLVPQTTVGSEYLTRMRIVSPRRGSEYIALQISGLRRGDEILALDGVPITSIRSAERNRTQYVGRAKRLTVQRRERDGSVRVFELETGNR